MKIKQRLLAILCVCVLLFASAAQAADIKYGYGYVSQVLTYFRMAPSTEAGYCSQLDKGTQVLVTGSEGAFYKVTYNGKSGYIMKTCVSSDRPATTGTAAAANTWTANKTAYISEELVYFRKAPTVQAEYYYQLNKGTQVTLTGESGIFYKVSYGGLSGYVMKTCVSLTRVAGQTGNTNTAAAAVTKMNRTGYISLDKVYFRKAASTDAGFYCQLSLGTQVNVTGETGLFYAVTYGGTSGYVMKTCVTFTRPAVTTQPGSIWNESKVGYISEVNVYFRKGPSTDAGYHTQLAKGTQVTVTGESGNFYKVTYGALTGYIMKNCLNLTSTATVTDGTGNGTVTETLWNVSRTGYISEVLVYFRKGPSTSAGYYTQLNKGTVVTALGESGNFYKVSYGGLSGYIMKNCLSFTSVVTVVTPSPEPAASDVFWTESKSGYVTESGVFLRKGPSMTTGFEKMLDKGTIVKVIGENSDYYIATYAGYTGYIAQQYVSFTAGTGTDVIWAAAKTGYISMVDVYFRKAASTSADSYQQLAKGTAVTVTGENGIFYKVTYGGLSGYIMKTCISLTEPVITAVPSGDTVWTVSKTGYITDNAVYFRTAPSTASGSYGQLNKNTAVTVSGENGYFYKVTYGGVSGYVMKNYVTFTAPSGTSTPSSGDTIWTTTRVGYVTLDNTYFRSGPATTYDSYGMLAKNSQLLVKGENGNFYKVTYGGTSGYVMKEYVTFTAPSETSNPSGDTIWTTTKTGYITLDNTNFRSGPATTYPVQAVLSRNTAVTVRGVNGDFYKVYCNGQDGYVMKSLITFTAPSDGTSGETIWAKPKAGFITLDNTYFRSGPATSYAPYGQLSKNTQVVVKGENGNFYKVYHNGQDGYVMKNLISFTEPSETTAPISGDTIWTTPRTGYITLDNTYLRSGPATTYDPYGLLRKNDQVLVKGENGNFYKVTYSSYVGYVMKNYVTFTAPSETSTPSSGDTIWTTTRTGYITLDNTNFRSGPATTYSAYAVLSRNTAVTVRGENGDFYKVTSGGQDGYVMKSLITFTAPSDGTSGETIWAKPKAGFILMNNTYFRSGPATSYTSYRQLSRNTMVIVRGENGNFYKVTYNGQDGYVMKSLISFTEPEDTPAPISGDTIWTTPKTGYITLDNTYLRSGPATTYDPYGLLRKNDQVLVKGENGNFYKVTYSSYVGYVMKNYVTFTAPSETSTPSSGDTDWSASRTGYIVMNDVFFRTAPSTASGHYMMLSKNTAITVTGENGSFYKVTYSGKTGYVMMSMVTFTKPSESQGDSIWTTSKTGYITLNETNFRKEASTTAYIYQQLAKNTAVTVTGENGNFYKVIYNGYSGYVMRDYVTFTNPSGGGSSSSGTTERLDWFNGGEAVIPRGATFQMKDCYTGKVISCVRQAGGNHLDAEPLTAADTATLLSVYGGTWSYVRRPVLVKYNGHVYAGSIYCEPHGEQTILDNNFDGQFCIHFYGSRTHGSNNVDADHQACVAIAMGYSW